MASAADAVTLRVLQEGGVLQFNDGYRTERAELGFDGFPILRVAQVLDGHITETEGAEYVRKEYRDKIGSKLAKDGDIVLTTKGTVGRRARVSRRFTGYVYSPQVCFFRVIDRNRLDSDYLYYWLGSQQFLGQIHGLRAQTDMAEYVNLRDLGTVGLRLPRPGIQRRVAGVLRALDDKIELNRRMARTLEAIARATFKSWFVDFDPVRAKTEGRPPTVPAELAELFPVLFVESPIGPVPEGWGVAPLEEHVEVVRGLSYRGADLADEGLPLHNLNSVLDGGGYKYEGIKFYAGEYKERHLVEPGDVIVANTDLTHRGQVLGSPAIVPAIHGNEGLFSADLFRVRPQEGSRLTRRFVYLLLMSGRLRQQVTAYSSGTTVNHLSIEGLRRPRFVVPPRKLIEAFDQLVRSMFELAEGLVAESRTLAETRDWLLPRLVSGRVRVRAGGAANYSVN